MVGSRGAKTQLFTACPVQVCCRRCPSASRWLRYRVLLLPIDPPQQLPSLCASRSLYSRPHHTCAQIRNHLQSFLLGGVAALSFGYYRLHQDVYMAAEAVESRLGTLGKETVRSQATLQARLDALEGEVSKLKSAQGAES